MKEYFTEQEYQKHLKGYQKTRARALTACSHFISATVVIGGAGIYLENSMVQAFSMACAGMSYTLISSYKKNLDTYRQILKLHRENSL